MDELSGESEQESVISKGKGESEIEDLVYQNEIDEEIKGVDSRMTLGGKRYFCSSCCDGNGENHAQRLM